MHINCIALHCNRNLRNIARKKKNYTFGELNECERGCEMLTMTKKKSKPEVEPEASEASDDEKRKQGPVVVLPIIYRGPLKKLCAHLKVKHTHYVTELVRRDLQECGLFPPEDENPNWKEIVKSLKK
jgi:hypothetical protein